MRWHVGTGHVATGTNEGQTDVACSPPSLLPDECASNRLSNLSIYNARRTSNYFSCSRDGFDAFTFDLISQMASAFAFISRSTSPLRVAEGRFTTENVMVVLGKAV